MRKETFTNERTETLYVRVSKKTAYKIFKDGHTLIICPHNQNMSSWPASWEILEYDDETTYFSTCKDDFDAHINRFEYYNNTYPKYFIPATIAAAYK